MYHPYIMFVMSAGSRFWARLWSPGKGVTGEGLWFDLRVGYDLWGGWKICIQSSVSNEFAVYCMYIVQIRRAMLRLPDATSRYTFQKCCCALKPWISVGQLLPRLELNQIVWTMIATARLFLRQQWTTAQMWDAQKKGRAMVSSDQNPSQLVYVVEITQFYGVWNILMWIWIWNVRHKWRHP